MRNATDCSSQAVSSRAAGRAEALNMGSSSSEKTGGDHAGPEVLSALRETAPEMRDNGGDDN